MNSNLRRHQEVHDTLRQLEQYPTLSPFCRLFYRFIDDLTEEPEPDVGKLEQAFLIFLRCERRRHEAVGRIIGAGALDTLKIVRVSRDAHRTLDRLRSYLERMELADRKEQIIRELILAECNYHLGRTADVVVELRHALALGCDHALAHFALGYNTYLSAMQKFTVPGPRKGQHILRDPLAFEKECRVAISAFEQGLGNRGYDAQIHWWVGILWEILGERTAARGAFKSAMEADPENFTNQAIEKLQGMEASEPIKRSTEELNRLARLQPITENEIREAKEFLEGCESPFFESENK